MKILLLGAGGREHALAWKIKASPLCKHLFVSPGNPGTAKIARNLNIQVNDFEKIANFIKDNDIQMVVVGPEDPLAKGLRDYLAANGLAHILFIGPGKLGAQLESSKTFSKDFMQRHHIPTAAYKSFVAGQETDAFQFIDSLTTPIVVKADGLASGKGVIIAETTEEAKTAVREMLSGDKFGSAGTKVVIEEFLKGIELSCFVLTDGKSYKILPSAKDYKRIGEGDSGPNTGGMGAVSPVPFANAAFMSKVEAQVIKPTIDGLAAENIPFQGFLFIGLMNVDNNPFVIEYNVRLGDPETEVILPRITSDLVALFEACAKQQLADYTLEISDAYATTVVMVSEGYPGSYIKGKIISGLDRKHPAMVFHAGTKSFTAFQTVTNGGRVLTVTGMGDTLEAALANSYAAAEKISWDGAYYRKDIGQDLLKLEKAI